MLVLAIDTSTPAITTGLVALDNSAATGRSEMTSQLLAERITVDARAHGELLTPHIQQVLAEAGISATQLDAIVCGAGPGPFTGLRVGMVTAAALGQALELPVFPVVSLDAIAAEVFANSTGEPLLVITDARRREVYWAAYDNAGKRQDGPHVQQPAELAAIASAHGIGKAAGQGAEMYAETLDLAVLPPKFPAPYWLVTACEALTSGTDPAPLTPLYLRRPDAEIPAARKKVGV